MPHRKTGRKGLIRRFLGWVGTLAIAWMVLTALLVLSMRWIHPVTSAFMIGARVAAVIDGNFRYSNDFRWMDFRHISPNAGLAVIASEDQQFPYHFGFDFKAIKAAEKHNEHSKRIRGASTISQQVAKNLFLWKGRSYLRKGLEVWFTMLVESMWSKERILEVYLNIAEFGPGVYGVEAASQRFYRHPAAKLTRYEAATLAAVLPNPRRLRVDRPSRYVVSRRDWIAGQMGALGGRAYLNQLEADVHQPKRIR